MNEQNGLEKEKELNFLVSEQDSNQIKQTEKKKNLVEEGDVVAQITDLNTLNEKEKLRMIQQQNGNSQSMQDKSDLLKSKKTNYLDQNQEANKQSWMTDQQSKKLEYKQKDQAGDCVIEGVVNGVFCIQEKIGEGDNRRYLVQLFDLLMGILQFIYLIIFIVVLIVDDNPIFSNQKMYMIIFFFASNYISLELSIVGQFLENQIPQGFIYEIIEKMFKEKQKLIFNVPVKFKDEPESNIRLAQIIETQNETKLNTESDFILPKTSNYRLFVEYRSIQDEKLALLQEIKDKFLIRAEEKFEALQKQKNQQAKITKENQIPYSNINSESINKSLAKLELQLKSHIPYILVVKNPTQEYWRSLLFYRIFTMIGLRIFFLALFFHKSGFAKILIHKKITPNQDIKPIKTPLIEISQQMQNK